MSAGELVSVDVGVGKGRPVARMATGIQPIGGHHRTPSMRGGSWRAAALQSSPLELGSWNSMPAMQRGLLGHQQHLASDPRPPAGEDGRIALPEDASFGTVATALEHRSGLPMRGMASKNGPR